MMKELMYHDFLKIKFLKASNNKIYVKNEREQKIYSLENYEKIYVFFHKKEEYEAVLRHIEIAKHFEEYLAGTWKPAPVEKKFNRI